MTESAEFCPRCGEALAERFLQARARQVCGKCGWVSYRQLKVGAGAAVQDNGRLLLVRRSPECDAFPNTWCIPAGYCEADESPRAAARREVSEETGVRIKVGRLVDVYFFDDDPRGNGLLILYEAEPIGGTPRGHEDASTFSTEVSDMGYFAPDDLPSPLCGGGHDRAIQAWSDRSADRWEPGAPLRHCPHCTHPLERRLSFGRTRPVCPACGYVHFKTPKVGVSLLVEDQGRVLLVQRGIEPGLGQWGLPSGFLECDETPEEGARRECEEETGALVKDLEILDVSAYADDFRGAGINLTYRARFAGGPVAPGDDAMQVAWVRPGQLPTGGEIAFHSHRALLQRWRLESE